MTCLMLSVSIYFMSCFYLINALREDYSGSQPFLLQKSHKSNKYVPYINVLLSHP